MTLEDNPLLPELRKDLQFLAAPHAYDGAPTWTLHDPASNRFFRIGAMAFCMLNDWGSVKNQQELINKVSGETVFTPTCNEVSDLILFLHANKLTTESHTLNYREHLVQHRQHNARRWKRLLEQYLFFRVPLFYPDAFLDKAYPFIRKFCSLNLLYTLILISVTGLYLVSRQWDTFINTLPHFVTPYHILLYAAALTGTKILHELGHVCTARYYGCRVPSMGIAFMTMVPMLYSDMTDTWRLKSRKQRIHVAGAGILNEVLLAGICLFLWALLQDGVFRSTCFILATTSLISSLAINITPFMRFDGYYILSDWWEVDNLQNRSFQLARWKLRQIVLGVSTEKPEHLPPGLEFRLICYAWLTWLYRLVLFFGIALLVYHLFFKLLGIILFVTEIIMLLLMPVFKEIRQWWKLREGVSRTNRVLIWSILLSGCIGLLFIPWSTHIRIPGVLTAAATSSIYSPESAQITSIAVKRGQYVNKDQVLMTLRSPALEKEIALAKKQLAIFKLQAMRAITNQQDQHELQVTMERITAESDRLEGLKRRQAMMHLRSPFSGILAEMDETLQTDQWTKNVTPLFFIRSPSTIEIKGIASEHDLSRLEPGQQAIFYPENPFLPELAASIDRIDWGNIKYLDIPYLDSRYGGEITTRKNIQGLSVPETTSYAIRLSNILPAAIDQEIKGSIVVEGKSTSLIGDMYDLIVSAIIRESNF